MTTFRSNRVDVERLQFIYASSSEPDEISVEVALDGNVLLEVSVDQEGIVRVLFDTDGGQFEFEKADLDNVLSRCEAELLEWRSRLQTPGGMWERNQ